MKKVKTLAEQNMKERDKLISKQQGERKRFAVKMDNLEREMERMFQRHDVEMCVLAIMQSKKVSQ